jgi:dienelactone hydrolase
MEPREVIIPPAAVAGDLTIPADVAGLVIFVHGSGSSRLSPRNRLVARDLNQGGFATLLFDLLRPEEDSAENRFAMGLLPERLITAVEWAADQPALRDQRIGLFGASTGSAAALIGAAKLGSIIGAIVSRGGRPDLAAEVLPAVTAPTLLIVGEQDHGVIDLNWKAYEKLRCWKRFDIVPRATHLFEEPGTLEEVSMLASSWFAEHLRRSG